jgi:hypothetical protein
MIGLPAGTLSRKQSVLSHEPESAFDVIVVHSYSRFFRKAFEQEFYLRKLVKHNVKVVSITQPVGYESEPVHSMMHKVIARFDEFQSRENARHVIRSMKENAWQRFWCNGPAAANVHFAVHSRGY